MATAPKRHNQSQTRRPPDNRKPSSQRGYNSQWRRLKRAVSREESICELCWELDGRVVAKDLDDHIVPFYGLSDPLRLDRGNVRGLCRSCHAMKTQRYDDAVRAEYERIRAGEGHDVARDRVVAKWRLKR